LKKKKKIIVFVLFIFMILPYANIIKSPEIYKTGDFGEFSTKKFDKATDGLNQGLLILSIRGLMSQALIKTDFTSAVTYKQSFEEIRFYIDQSNPYPKYYINIEKNQNDDLIFNSYLTELINKSGEIEVYELIGLNCSYLKCYNWTSNESIIGNYFW